MRRRTSISIFAILTASTLLSGTAAALAACNTFAEARALHPNSYLAYRVIGDAHCWYAGYPNRRDEPVVQKQERQAMLSPKRDKVVDPKPVQEPARPYWLQSTNQSWLAEDKTQNWSVDRPQITQHQPPTIDTVDVVDADASALERQSRSLEIAFATLRRGMSVG